MIQIPSIKNTLERECTEYVTNYIQKFTNLYLKTINELDYYRRKDNILIIQPPYRNNAGNVQYNDLSIICKSYGIDNRYEFSSLEPNSTLKGKGLIHSLEANNIPEQLLVLVLIGNGYDEIVQYTIKPLIKTNKLRVTVIRTVEEYKNHIDTIFRRMYR